MSNMVGVRILFGGSLYFNLIMDKAEAIRLIKGFRDGTLTGSVGDDRGGWAVKTESIHCIHMEEIQAGQPVQGPPPQHNLPGLGGRFNPLSGI